MKPLYCAIASLLMLNAAMGQTKPAADSTIRIQYETAGARDSTDYLSVVFTKVDVPAAFPGGANGWKAYLESNLKYPKKAQKKGIQGVVRVQFIVDKTGKVSEAAVLSEPGGGLGEEAVRIIMQGPNWVPATQNGKKVIYRHIQSITFALE